MEKLQNHKFYYLNEEIEEKEEEVIEKKEEKIDVATLVSEEVRKTLEQLNIKEQIKLALGEAMEIKKEVKEEIKPNKIEDSIESIRKKLELQEQEVIASKKEEVVRKYGIDMEDLENFKDVASIEKLIEKVSSKAKERLIKDDGYIKKDDRDKIAKAMLTLNESEEYIKLEDKKKSETLSTFRNLFKKK
jgi:valyl-tRNA synthetase